MELDSLQQFQLAAAFPIISGFGILNANCNVNTIAGDSIVATVSLDTVVAPPLTVNCPNGGTGGNVLRGPTSTGLIANNLNVAEFDLAAVFNFAAGTRPGQQRPFP